MKPIMNRIPIHHRLKLFAIKCWLLNSFFLGLLGCNKLDDIEEDKIDIEQPKNKIQKEEKKQDKKIKTEVVSNLYQSKLDTEKKLTQTKEKITQLKQAKIELEKKISDAQKQEEISIQQQELLQEKELVIQELYHELEQLNRQKERTLADSREKEISISSLQFKVEKLMTKKQNIKERLKRKKTTIKSLKEREANKEIALDPEKKRVILKNKLAAAEKCYKKASNEHKNLETELKKLPTQIFKKTADIELSKKICKDLKKRLEETANLIQENETTIQALKKQEKDSLQPKDTEEIQEKITTFEKKNKEDVELYEAYKKQIILTEQKITSLNQDKIHEEIQMRKLGEKFKTAKANQETARKEIEEITVALEN